MSEDAVAEVRRHKGASVAKLACNSVCSMESQVVYVIMGMLWNGWTRVAC